MEYETSRTDLMTLLLNLFLPFVCWFVSFGASGTESLVCYERDLGGANSHLSISIVSEI